MSESASIYGVITSWLTPSCLFVFINIVIGTIVITSRFANTTKKQHHHQLVRSPSLLARLTSFNFNFSYHKHEPTTTPHGVVGPVQSHDSPWLNRVLSSSLLDRVKSFNNEEKTERLNPVEQEGLNRVQLNMDRIPSSSLLDRVRSFSLSFNKAEVERFNPVEQNLLDRVPSSSLLDQVRSFNLSFNKAEIKGTDSIQQLNHTPSILQRIKSLTFNRSESVKESPDAESEGEVMSGGELMEEKEEEEGVDAKADDFINRFRQQLRLQRLDSIIRYRDILKRN